MHPAVCLLVTPVVSHGHPSDLRCRAAPRLACVRGGGRLGVWGDGLERRTGDTDWRDGLQRRTGETDVSW